tara:strand:- start:9369 stop:9818 length:450 start_codon:yes stop_codon:yes gene_type:complete
MNVTVHAKRKINLNRAHQAAHLLMREISQDLLQILPKAAFQVLRTLNAMETNVNLYQAQGEINVYSPLDVEWNLTLNAITMRASKLRVPGLINVTLNLTVENMQHVSITLAKYYQVLEAFPVFLIQTVYTSMLFVKMESSREMKNAKLQ